MSSIRVHDPVAEFHEQLRGWFGVALARIDVRTVMAQQFVVRDGCVCVGELSYTLRSYRRVMIVAVGKASETMVTAALDVLRPALSAEQAVTGIAVSVGEGEGLPPEIRFAQASHPVPGRGSRAAAEAVMNLLREAERTDLVLFLLSGGASAMLESPADPAVSVEQTAAFYRALLYSGLPITAMNTLRKHLSAVKGGHLAAIAAPATQCTLLISDVPGNALEVVGSGPSLPDPTTLADCQAILASPQGRAAFSAPGLQPMLARCLHETPKPGDAIFAHTEALCLLSNRDLVEPVRELAARDGYHVVVDNTCDDWDFREASCYLVERVQALRQQHGRVCLVSGGEVTVHVPEGAGVGGRNQHFALATAMQLDGVQPFVAVLSAGSDGVDGNSPATGALADSFTLARAERHGLRAVEALERFDSYPLFLALGDTVVTGPTGNNVRDLRVLLSC